VVVDLTHPALRAPLPGGEAAQHVPIGRCPELRSREVFMALRLYRWCWRQSLLVTFQRRALERGKIIARQTGIIARQTGIIAPQTGSIQRQMGTRVRDQARPLRFHCSYPLLGGAGVG